MVPRRGRPLGWGSRARGDRPRPSREPRRQGAAHAAHGHEPVVREGAPPERLAGARREGRARVGARGEVGAELHLVEHHQAHVASRLLRLAVRGCGRPDARRLRRLRLDDAGARATARRSRCSTACSSRTRSGSSTPRSRSGSAFPSYGDEGKVMGLAPYGTPRYLEEMRSVVQEKGDLFELGLDFFRHHKEGVDMTWDERHARRSVASSPSAWRRSSARHASPTSRSRRSTRTSPRRCRRGSRRSTCTSSRGSAARTGSPNICLAGGVALNAVANGRIRPETPFEEVFVQPAAGDSGIAVGAAFHVWHQGLGRPRGFAMEHAYCGAGLRRRRVRRGAGGGGPRGGAARRRRARSPRVAERIADGDVVGWFQGRMEYGPRALGNRSIVADPRRRGHEGHPQRPDQAPRAVPAVRSLDPRGGRPASGSSRTTPRPTWCSSTRRGPRSVS